MIVLRFPLINVEKINLKLICTAQDFFTVLFILFILSTYSHHNKQIWKKKIFDLKENLLLQTTPMAPIVNHIDFKKRARHVDKIARVVFPSTFFIFNISFWVFYLVINKDNKFWIWSWLFKSLSFRNCKAKCYRFSL